MFTHLSLMLHSSSGALPIQIPLDCIEVKRKLVVKNSASGSTLSVRGRMIRVLPFGGYTTLTASQIWI